MAEGSWAIGRGLDMLSSQPQAHARPARQRGRTLTNDEFPPPPGSPLLARALCEMYPNLPSFSERMQAILIDYITNPAWHQAIVHQPLRVFVTGTILQSHLNPRAQFFDDIGIKYGRSPTAADRLLANRTATNRNEARVAMTDPILPPPKPEAHSSGSAPRFLEKKPARQVSHIEPDKRIRVMNSDLTEVQPHKRRKLTLAESKQTAKTRKRGACAKCKRSRHRCTHTPDTPSPAPSVAATSLSVQTLGSSKLLNSSAQSTHTNSYQEQATIKPSKQTDPPAAETRISLFGNFTLSSPSFSIEHLNATPSTSDVSYGSHTSPSRLLNPSDLSTSTFRKTSLPDIRYEENEPSRNLLIHGETSGQYDSPATSLVRIQPSTLNRPFEKPDSHDDISWPTTMDGRPGTRLILTTSTAQAPSFFPDRDVSVSTQAALQHVFDVSPLSPSSTPSVHMNRAPASHYSDHIPGFDNAVSASVPPLEGQRGYRECNRLGCACHGTSSAVLSRGETGTPKSQDTAAASSFHSGMSGSLQSNGGKSKEDVFSLSTILDPSGLFSRRNGPYQRSRTDLSVTPSDPPETEGGPVLQPEYQAAGMPLDFSPMVGPSLHADSKPDQIGTPSVPEMDFSDPCWFELLVNSKAPSPDIHGQ